MSRASKEVLDGLHNAVATALADKIASGSATAGDLSAAIKFLKDNGIDAVATGDNPLARIRDTLPFPNAASVEAEKYN